MKREDIRFKLEYELTEIRRTGRSRLADLDGFFDRLAYLAHDVMSAVRAIFRELGR